MDPDSSSDSDTNIVEEAFPEGEELSADLLLVPPETEEEDEDADVDAEDISLVSLVRRVHYFQRLDSELPDDESDSYDVPQLAPRNARRYLQSILTVYKGFLPDSIHSDIDTILRAERCKDPVVFAPRKRPYLFQGSIVTLQVDAIVNAANESLLGCFTPFHMCIDNVIHSAAGPRLREEILRKLEGWGLGLHKGEATGKARITGGHWLPAKHVLHTVGPIYPYHTPEENSRLLASCYRECLNVAAANGCKSIAFCCISTGVFRYPNKAAAVIALKTVREWVQQNWEEYRFDAIVFNVFKEIDKRLYESGIPQCFAGPFWEEEEERDEEKEAQ